MKLFNKIYLKLLLFYTTQFLPLGFFFGAIPAILGTNGVSMEVIGSIYMLGIFWVIKFLWAPFIDKYTLFKSKGHYKGWLYFIQSFLAICMIVCAFFPITESFVISLCLIALINILSSIQDICVDGLVLNSINKDELEYANSMQSIGTFLGSFLGLVLPLISYELYNWKVTLLILSVFVISPIFFLYNFEEKPKTSISNRYSYFSMFKFLKQKNVLGILIIMLPAYWIVESTFGLFQQLLLQYKWNLIEIVISQNVVASIFGVVGALLVGNIIHKYGKDNTYKVVSILILLDVIFMINYESYFENHTLVTALFSYNYFCLGLYMTVYYTYIMSNSTKEFAGSQINIQHGFLLLLSMLFTKLIFNMTASYGFEFVFKVLAAIFILTTLYSFYFFRKFKDEK